MSASDAQALLDFRAIFEAAPSPNLIVRADPPFTIVAANDAYLAATMTTRERIVGRAIFDAFPNNPNDPEATGVRNIRESIEHVVAHRQPHTMAVQRYDVPRPDGSGFEERYWSPIHTPVFGPDGEVAYVIQRPEDVTEFVRLKARAGEQDRREAELRGRAEQMEAEVFLRARELAEANADLRRQVEERERAEAALAREQDFLRAILDNAGDGIVACDGEGVLRFFNQAAREFHGLPEQPLPPERWAERYDLYKPDGKTRLSKEQVPLFRALYEGTVRDAEMVIAAKGRPARLLTASGRAITDADGQKLGAVVVMHDLTARKLVEEQRERAVREEAARLGAEASSQRLAESEARLRLALGAARMVVWEFDPATGRASVSEGADDLYGLAPAQKLERSEHGFALVHPDDVAEHRARFAKAVADGVGYVAQFRMVRQDSAAVVWVEERAHAVRGEGGRIVRLVGVQIDITDRKRDEEALRESEARFRQLADAMPQMVWVTRPDGHHEYFNERWYEFTGAAEGSTDGEGWNRMFHPEDQQRAWAAWRHSLATGDPYEIEYRLRHHSGEYRWTLGRALPIRDAGGAVTRWFGTCTDIDALKRWQQEREHLLDSEQAARAEAERAGRMKDEFLATLSHELRTPLNAILGWATILLGDNATAASDDLREGLETIERNARAQTQIIEDLLDMSRIISGKVRLDVQQVDLAAIARGVVETVKPVADAKAVRVHAVLDPLDAPVFGDPNRLQQVFWNLLTNAIKFTPKGGRVQVLLERVNSHVEVRVTDTGEGIRPEFLPHVFDRFRQADASTTRRHGGLGLGLGIVKQLVELHGGTVTANSAGVGRGSTFVVALPLTPVQPDPQAQLERRPPEATGLAQPLNPDLCRRIAGLKVLVVDDEADSRAVVQRLLEACGAVVLTSGSASEALTRVAAERPDVLLSDIGMPAEDGYSLIRRVRALGPERGGKVPAIALTAYARSEDRTRSVLAGFQMHVAKPVEPSELIAMVATLAGRTL